MVVRIAGERLYLRRAVDDEGEVLDMLVQRRRDSWAALRLMRKLLKKQGFVPKLLVADFAESDDIFGEGVNIAARLEALAEAGSICVSLGSP
jgi:transposase-like protein